MSKRVIGWATASLIIIICATLAGQVLSQQVGLHYYRTGEYKKALPWLRTAMVLNPFTSSIRIAAAGILVKEGRLDEGERILQANIRRHPGDSKSHNLMGIVHERRGNMEAALEEYKKAAELDDRYAEAFFNVGYVLFKMGRFDESREAFDTAVKIAPELSTQRDEILQKFPVKIPL